MEKNRKIHILCRIVAPMFIWCQSLKYMELYLHTPRMTAQCGSWAQEQLHLNMCAKLSCMLMS